MEVHMFGIPIIVIAIAALVGAVVIASLVGLAIVTLPDLVKLYRIHRM
jgi:hypothetical protein